MKVSQFRKYLQTNLGTKAMSSTAISFQCPILRLNRGTVDWGTRGPLWKRVESCMASASKFGPVDEAVPSLFSIDQVAKNLKRKGYGIIIFVNVLGGQDMGPWSKDDWVARAYWSEVRRHIWQAKAEFTDVIEIDTQKFGPFDFKAKTGLKGVGERTGKSAARQLVEKYKL